MNDTTTPDAYWLEVGSRPADADECGIGASLGPYATVEIAEATAQSIRGWTLGQIEERGLGEIDTYGTGPDGKRTLAARKDEIVRWALVREQWVDNRDVNGIVTSWNPGDTIAEVYDDTRTATEKAA